MKRFQVRLKHQTVTRSSQIVGRFGFELSQSCFVVGGEGLIVGMSRTSVVGDVCVGGGPFGWEIQGIEPTLRSQHRFFIFPVEIHRGLQIGFVMVSVRLGADQGAIQSQVNLFDDGVSQIVGDPKFFVSPQVPSIVLFQSQFHREVTAIQIHMVVQRGNDEFHGVDPRGGGMNGHHAIGIDADVGGWDPENVQSRIDDLFGTCVSSLGHVAVVVFNAFSSSVPVVVWMHRLDVARGFYTVVFVSNVAPNQTRKFFSHWQPTIPRIEANHDFYA